MQYLQDKTSCPSRLTFVLVVLKSTFSVALFLILFFFLSKVRLNHACLRDNLALEQRNPFKLMLVEFSFLYCLSFKETIKTNYRSLYDIFYFCIIHQNNNKSSNYSEIRDIRVRDNKIQL